MANCNNSFTTAGVFYWVAPDRVKSAQVEVWAGGAGGGVRNRTGNNGGGGGGGGGYSRSNVTVVPGTNYRGNIGAGGAGGYNNANGNNGANSDFNNSQILARYGVRGASAGTGGVGGCAGTGDVTFAGGAGATKVANVGGGGGAGGGFSANGQAGSGATPGTGTGGGGSGGAGGQQVNANGNNGVQPGGGGGGASNGSSALKWGGNGAAGKVLITYRWIDVEETQALLEGEGELQAPTVILDMTVSIGFLEGEGQLAAPEVHEDFDTALEGEGELFGTLAEGHQILAASQDNPLEAEGELFAPTVRGGRLMGFLQGEGELQDEIRIKINIPPLTVVMGQYEQGEGDLWGELVEGHRILAASQDDPLEGEGELLEPYVEARAFDIDCLAGEGDLFGEVTGVETALLPDEQEGEGELLSVTVIAQVGDSCTVKPAALAGEGEILDAGPVGWDSAVVRPEFLEGEGDLWEQLVVTGVTRILGPLEGAGRWMPIGQQAPKNRGEIARRRFILIAD